MEICEEIKEEHHVNPEAEIKLPQAEGCLGLPGARRDRERSFPLRFQGCMALPNFELRLLASRTVRQ